MISATNYAQNYAGIIGKALLISTEASLLQSAIYACIMRQDVTFKVFGALYIHY